MNELLCRFCNTKLSYTFSDLGMSPLSNAYVTQENSQQAELFYPLHAYVCDNCFLVQLPQVQTSENIFSDYAYFSSFSDSWLSHSKKYVEMIVRRFQFHDKNLIIEIASNDGYLLQYFQEYNIPVLGIEPAKNVAKEAIKSGIPTLTEFLGEKLALGLSKKGQKADLLIGNNVLAHVPDINDFVKGMKIILNPGGVVTMEFPHLMRLIMEKQFDTIYHEHFSYFSFISVNQIFKKHGLKIFDVEELPTHGGSLRIYACHSENNVYKKGPRTNALLQREINGGYNDLKYYFTFSKKVQQTKIDILSFFIEKKKEGKQIVGYGAPAKGNTLLNYCGIKTDFIDYTVDRSPHKQGLFLPGTHIPIYHPDKIKETKPDYVVILPWNLKDEIMPQMSHIAEWGGAFVTLIPEVNVYDSKK
jgi:SAM-dependent methyltransferase